MSFSVSACKEFGSYVVCNEFCKTLYAVSSAVSGRTGRPPGQHEE